MKPTLVLVGRPNVGKSTLFNRLTRSRDAIVADFPGLTRDRHYGHGVIGEKPFLVVDTGGFEPVAKDGILHEMARQTLLAVDEADVIVFLVDARQGLNPQDKTIADILRRSQRKVLLAVNKAEGLSQSVVGAEFYELGLGEPYGISATHGDHVQELVEIALEDYPYEDEAEPAEPPTDRPPRIAVVGRPNVGKSTLINGFLGEERLIAFDQPGTTRDSIDVEFERNGKPYVLVDTAGIRKRGKVFEAIEKFSVIKTLQAVEDANVVVLVLDARQEISEQDAHIAGFVLETGRALVVAVNKWDHLERERRDAIKAEIDRKLKFLQFANFNFISALRGQGLNELLTSIDKAYAAAMAKLSTPRLTRVLEEAVTRHPPPHSGLHRPKMRYAHQGGSNPPVIVIHGNALNNVAESYKRYLENTFREAFALHGTPLRVQFKQGSNPFENKKAAPATKREENKSRRERRFRRRAYG